MPEFEAAHNVACDHALKGTGDAVEMLRRPGGKSVMIVVILVPARNHVFVVESVLDVTSNSGPENRFRAER